MNDLPHHANFVSARDALLAAEDELHAGANTCRIWKAFARRGLGFSAAQGAADNNADNIAAYDMPATCEEIFVDGFEP